MVVMLLSPETTRLRKPCIFSSAIFLADGETWGFLIN
jgi:hypothetical protein